MIVTNITNDSDDITSGKYTDILNDIRDLTLRNCTDNENNFDINIPTLLLILTCVLSFLCLMSLMVYTLIKPFFNNE